MGQTSIISYLIHDNGSRPFKVEILNDKIVNIYNNYTEQLLFTYMPEKIFIGRSPKIPTTEYSGGYGPEFDGNSILLKMTGLNYIYIGERIYEFTALAEIIKYISVLGNSDVPYPWAIDDRGNHYLMIENVILSDVPHNVTDTYHYYYDIHLITADRGCIPPTYPTTKKIKNFQNIESYMIGDKRFTLRYKPNPEDNYDRIMNDPYFEGGPIYIIKTNNTKIKLNKTQYVKLMKDFGKRINAKKLEIKMIHERL